MGHVYDCAIVGGGVAGLALSILLARTHKEVILFEKEDFPFHKVCGEYISNESIPFLEALGINFKDQNLPYIDQLFLSSPAGLTAKRPLDIGGVGLSRFKLDHQLYQIALASGVKICTKTKVQQLDHINNLFKITTSHEQFNARTAVGAYGKRSNIDVQLGRNYKAQKEKDLFIAVKYHIRTDFNRKQVEMHNFPGGYCGLSAIEQDKINMSYISKASNLKKHGSIANLEKNVLSTNPFLKTYFDKAEFVFEKPITISHLYFNIKQPVNNNILMLGDAAGNIAPLSGNGMSMALQSSKIAYNAIISYLKRNSTLSEMGSAYEYQYSQTFKNRIHIAKQINHLFGSPLLTNTGFVFLKIFPKLIDIMGKRIHGETF